MLSNATEIHVNAPPYHPLMPHNDQYIYHDETSRMYFGRYNITANDIEYAIKPKEEPKPEPVVPTAHNRGQGNHHSNNASTAGDHPHHSGGHNRVGSGGKHGTHGHGHGHAHGKHHGKNSHSAHDQSKFGHNSTSSLGASAMMNSSIQLSTSMNIVIRNAGVNVTIQVEILKNTSLVDTFTLLQSSYSEGIKLNGSNFALNRTMISNQASFLVREGSTPVFSTATTFDVKVSISVALCTQSTLLESYSFAANSYDLRDGLLPNLTQIEANANATVNKERVTMVRKSLLSTSAISLPLI